MKPGKKKKSVQGLLCSCWCLLVVLVAVRVVVSVVAVVLCGRSRDSKETREVPAQRRVCVVLHAAERLGAARCAAVCARRLLRHKVAHRVAVGHGTQLRVPAGGRPGELGREAVAELLQQLQLLARQRVRRQRLCGERLLLLLLTTLRLLLGRGCGTTTVWRALGALPLVSRLGLLRLLALPTPFLSPLVP